MTEANEDITNQPADGSRRRDITNEPPRGADAYEQGQPAPPPKSKTWLYVMLGVGIPSVLLILVIGLVITAVARMRAEADARRTRWNCKQMVLALNNIAGNSTVGYIPSSYGVFPPGATTNESFFVSLLPYLEENNLYTNWASNTTTPVKTYLACWDPYNPGTSGLISYGSNATVLTVGGQPLFPGSFGGRTSQIIVVFERTAKSGATWSSSNSYLIDQNGSSSPEFTGPNSWSSYGTKATALTSAGCVVGMGDGSAPMVTQGNATAGWAWAMDPSITSNQPAGW